jgi:hypothetical protein
MQISRRKRLIRKRKLVAYSGRGEIYSWLRAHHGQIVALRVGEERPWSEVLADMREDLAGGEGAPAVTLNNVCNIWQRVCRDVAAEPARQRVLFPSRLPKDWRPQVVSPVMPASAPPAGSLVPYVPPLPAQALSPASSSGGKGRVIDEAGRARGLAEIARAMRALENIDISTFGPGVNVGPPPIRAVSGDNPVRDASGEPEDA